MNTARELALIAWAYKGKMMASLPDVCRDIAQNSPPSKFGQPLAPATLRARIRYLVAACRYAWKMHGYGTSDPGARVMTPQVKNERQTYIDRAQMLRIARKVQNRGVRRVIRIAFYSGMRLSEILRATVAGGYFSLDDTKNGEPRIVPIHPKIRPAAHAPWKPAKSTVQAYFRKAARECGHADLHFHDLRHSSASEMINAGVDLYTIGAVLGHKDAASTKRYSHLATASLAKALGTIGKKSPTTGKKKAA